MAEALRISRDDFGFMLRDHPVFTFKATGAFVGKMNTDLIGQTVEISDVGPAKILGVERFVNRLDKPVAEGEPIGILTDL